MEFSFGDSTILNKRHFRFTLFEIDLEKEGCSHKNWVLTVFIFGIRFKVGFE